MGESATAPLSPMEKAAVALGRLTNEIALLKRIQRPILEHVTRGFVRAAIGRRTFVDRAERICDLAPDRGVMLCANHRSFFDMYVTMLALFQLRCPWLERLYFPVRSTFFYESPAGIAINLAFGASTMYPPIFRDPAKASLNNDALMRLAGFLERPGTLVGVHPEGTRNKTDDPYTLLPAQFGIGKIALHAKPIIIPMFIHGIGNDFVGGVRTTWSRDGRTTAPVIVTFGEPLDYSAFTATKPRMAMYKRCADHINEAIAALGPRERDLRARIEAGALADDPRWL